MRQVRTRRWLTVPMAVLTVLAVSAFGGDGDKDKQKRDDGKVLLDDEFVDDSNGWGGESTPELEVGVNQETETFDYLVNQDLDFFVAYYPDILLPRVDKLGDVRIEADVSFTSPGVAGIECRAADPSGETGDLSSYRFVAYPDGHVTIFKVPADGAEAPQRLATTEGEPAVFTDPGEGFVNLGAECVGGKRGKPVRLTMSIDGDEVLKAKNADDPHPTGGMLLISAKSSAEIEEFGFQPYAVVWDNVKLVQL